MTKQTFIPKPTRPIGNNSMDSDRNKTTTGRKKQTTWKIHI